MHRLTKFAESFALVAATIGAIAVPVVLALSQQWKPSAAGLNANLRRKLVVAVIALIALFLLILLFGYIDRYGSAGWGYRD